MIVLDVIFGCLLLFAGRILFWLCVGIVGFLIGAQSAAYFGVSTDSLTVFLAAVGCGLLGALLAVAFEWVMVVFGVGFLGGGYLLMKIFPPAAQQDPYSWLIFVVGGIIGTCLIVITFDWTLILISSLLGATLIVNAFHGTQASRELLFIGCTVTGMVLQYLALRGNAGQKRFARRR